MPVSHSAKFPYRTQQNRVVLFWYYDKYQDA